MGGKVFGDGLELMFKHHEFAEGSTGGEDSKIRHGQSTQCTDMVVTGLVLRSCSARRVLLIHPGHRGTATASGSVLHHAESVQRLGDGDPKR